MEELTQTLKDMKKEISNQSSSKPNIQKYMQRIDEIKKELGNKIHPMLNHYLKNHSYSKALRFIETGEEQ